MSDDATAPKPRRIPGRAPGPAQREELLRVCGYVDDDRSKLMPFFARVQGLVPLDTPLVMSDRVF